MAVGSDQIAAANGLYTLGLFKGSGTNTDGTPIYDLDRAPTRQEAITMLIRLLGKESEALSGEYSAPFTDVDAWAGPYVGYAYENGLALGTGDTTFGGSVTVTASEYLTFVLRALGYDSNTDFSWDKAWEKSDSIGLTDGEYTKDSEFLRGDVVIVSFDALSYTQKDEDTTLLAKLCADGAVTEKDIASVGLTSALYNTRVSLTAKEVSAMASPAVFYIEMYSTETDISLDGVAASGSGFFISASGIAVTNYHVIEGSVAAIVTTTDGEKYEVTRVIYYDKSRDIAVIRVSREAVSGETVKKFPFLTMTGSEEVSNGDVVYAIGSPLGLQNTISDGIVSNRSRSLVEDGLPYIQITAPISTGSSGGVLLNEYGEAIGVTTATFTAGQNMNLAVPLDSILNLDLTAEGVPYDKVYEKEIASLSAELTSTEDSVTIMEGNEETVYISVTTEASEFAMSFAMDDEDVAYCLWEGWVSDYVAALRIIGLSPGETVVRITTNLPASEENELCIAVIVE